MKITEKLKMIIKCALALDVKEISTDKGILLYDAEEVKEGVEVFIKDETEELKPAEDGTYTAEDGTIYEVVEGKISTITLKEEEVKEVEEEKVESEEVVVEPIEDEVKEEVEVEEPSMEEVIAKIEALTEVVTTLTNELNAIKGAYEELKERLNKIEAEPTADPIEEKPEVEEVKLSKMAYLRKK